MSHSARILVRRIGALGDVILTTPIVRRLRREHPLAAIGVQTGYPDVFRNSPHKLTIFPPGNLPFPWTLAGGLTRLIDLDLAYERRPSTHIVRAYMTEAFGDQGEPADLRQELFFTPSKADWPTKKPIVAVHAAKAGWRNRTLPETTWIAVIDGLRAAGFFPLLVGTSRDALPKAKTAAFHLADVLVQAGVIARCAGFVGSDSALLHVAGATSTPIVGIYTCAAPAYRAAWRGGVLGAGSVAITPSISCLGCLERQPIPTTRETCERGDIACVREVRASEIVEATVLLIGSSIGQ